MCGDCDIADRQSLPSARSTLLCSACSMLDRPDALRVNKTLGAMTGFEFDGFDILGPVSGRVGMRWAVYASVANGAATLTATVGEVQPLELIFQAFLPSTPRCGPQKTPIRNRPGIVSISDATELTADYVGQSTQANFTLLNGDGNSSWVGLIMSELVSDRHSSRLTDSMNRLDNTSNSGGFSVTGRRVFTLLLACLSMETKQMSIWEIYKRWVT